MSSPPTKDKPATPTGPSKQTEIKPLTKPSEIKPKNQLQELAQSPLPAWVTSAVCFSSVAASISKVPGTPHILQCFGFGAVFAGAGYAVSTGDWVNGAGINTAWSLTYLFLNGRKQLISRHPYSILVTALVAGNAALYGTAYFTV